MNIISPHTDPWVLTIPKFSNAITSLILPSHPFNSILLSLRLVQPSPLNTHPTFVLTAAARTLPLQAFHLLHVSVWFAISFLPHLYFLNWFIALFLFIILNCTLYKQWKCHKSSVPLQEHRPPGEAGLSQGSWVHSHHSCSDWNKTTGPDGQDLLNNPVTIALSVSKGSLLPHREQSTGKQLFSNAWKKTPKKQQDAMN